MATTNIKIKENIGFYDLVNAITKIVGAYFDGKDYTPYFGQIAEDIAIATMFLDGIEIKDDDDVMSIIASDKKISELISIFRNSDEFNFIQSNVKDVVEYEKQLRIHDHADMDTIVEACNVVIDSLSNFANMNISQMSDEDRRNAAKIMKALAESGDFTEEGIANAIQKAAAGMFNIDESSEKIIEEKNKKIAELSKYKALWESRNVLNEDDGK